MVLLGMFMLTLLVALPLSLALRGLIANHLGDSLFADAAASGTNYDWWQEFSAQASGLGTTFVPSIVGFGAVLDNLQGILDNLPMATTIAGATAAWMVLWSFLSGGVLDRYARMRPTRATGFFAACGTHFWRFLRIGLLAWLAYWTLFQLVHPLLFDDLYPSADARPDRRAIGVRCPRGPLSGFRRALAALQPGLRLRAHPHRRRGPPQRDRIARRRGAFVRRHPATLKLYLLNATAFILLALFYALVSPGAPSGLAMWIALAIGQFLRPAAPLREVALLRVADRLLPGRARARRLHGRATRRVARLTGG